MYLAVKKFLNDNAPLWSVITGIVSVVNLFFSKIALIQQTENRQQRSTKGATTTKKEDKENLIELLVIVIGGIKSYAIDVNDNELFSSVDYTQSDLEKLGDSLLIDRANLIMDIATANAANIADKGIGPVMLTNLQTLITEYDDSVPGPRNVISDKKSATSQLVVLFKETDEVLNENLDNVMLQFKLSSPDFYSNYVNNREIIDLGTQHTRLGGAITDNEGNPVGGVTVTAEGANLEEVSNEEGVYLFKPFIPGDFTIRAEKEGFLTKTIENVHVSPGEHLVLDIELEREVLNGGVNGGEQKNLLGPANPQWAIGRTVKIRNTTTGPTIGGLHFFAANNPGDGWDGSGEALFPGQEMIMILTAGQYKPYLNVYNQGPNTQSWEIVFLN